MNGPDNQSESTAVIQEQFEDSASQVTVDSKQQDNSQINQKIVNNPIEYQQSNSVKKMLFLKSEHQQKFSQMLVVARMRMDSQNTDLFVQHVINMERAIRKSIRDLLIQAKILANKQQFKSQREEIVQIFYDDINIGFITSTGQIKSTAYVYANRSMVGTLDRKAFNITFTKVALKVNLNIFDIENLRTVATPQSTKLDVKSAFIRTNKFVNEFLVLQQTNQNDLKHGISIYFVYRPIDDQIYAVKKVQQKYYYEQIKLSAQGLTFSDIFSNHPSTSQRKIREAKILSKLTHPNLLRLYDWWVEQSEEFCFLYLQLEYCSYPGYKYQPTDLLTYSYFYLNPMPIQQKIKFIQDIMLQIIDGLFYIHNRGIVHRDLKPENVFVTVTITGQLQLVLADFDQGKDVREIKLSSIGEDKLSENELNSVKSQNTIKAGTTGYQTPNSNKDENYDQIDEFFALGVTLAHMVLTFPGEPKNRNHYARTLQMSDPEDVVQLFDSWSVKFVKNAHPDFKFVHFLEILRLAKELMSKRFASHEEIKQQIKGLLT